MQELQTAPPSPEVADGSLFEEIRQLAQQASIEINIPELKDLEPSRAFLPAGKKIYLSCLPGQTWEETERASRKLHEAGFDPVPHIPVRLLSDRDTLSRLLENLVESAHAREVLLISGDYPRAVGPYSSVADVLRSGALQEHGVLRLSVAGHPEGHPNVPLAEIRRAEIEKALIAAQLRLDLTLLTQFFFEAAPFLDWVDELRSCGVGAHLVGGVSGPARAGALLKYAIRCGVGPSIRVLGARPSSVMKLMGDHGPQSVLRPLAAARSAGQCDFRGIHLFCFGGYLRTCEWLHRIAKGQFTLNHSGGFDV